MTKRNKLKNVAIRMVSAPPLYSDEPIDSPKAAVRVLGRELETYDREVVCVVNLRNDGAPINMSVVSMGTVDASIVGIREVFKAAILSNAAKIMLFHNHPGGSLTPSRQDVFLTKRIQAAADIIGIPLIDHVIIGLHGRYFSFYGNGMLNTAENVEAAAEKKESVRESISRYSRNCIQAVKAQEKDCRHNWPTCR